MKTNPSGRAAVARREGNVLTAYPDPATGGEPWTIGILSRDLATFQAAVSTAVKVSLNQNEFDALVSLAFNIGAGAFSKSTLM